MKKHPWRLLPILLVILVFSLFAIGSDSSDSGKKDIVTPGTETSAPADTADAAPASTPKPTTKDDTTIEEQVLLDTDGITITAKEYVTDSIWGDGIKLLIENNSDIDTSVSLKALIINDYMISDLFSHSVAAGKKANETLYLSSSELDAAGIDTIGKIELYFHLYNADTYDTICNPDVVTIQTSHYDDMDTQLDISGTELYADKGIRILGKYVDENSFWGASVLLYVENNSGKNIGVSVDDMSINGFMVTPFFSSSVYDGKKAVDSITLFSSDLEENGIEAIEDIELKFHIYDTDTYSTILDTDPITFSAN